MRALRQMYSDIYDTSVTKLDFPNWTKKGSDTVPLAGKGGDCEEKDKKTSDNDDSTTIPTCLACRRGYVEVCQRCLDQHCARAPCNLSAIQHSPRPQWPSRPRGQMNFRQMEFSSTILPSYTSRRLCKLLNEPCATVKPSFREQDEGAPRKRRSAAAPPETHFRRKRVPLSLGVNLKTDAHER